jgi:hypothetical protein
MNPDAQVLVEAMIEYVEEEWISFLGYLSHMEYDFSEEEVEELMAELYPGRGGN